MSIAFKTYKHEDLTFDVMSAGDKRKYKYTSSRLCSTKNNQLTWWSVTIIIPIVHQKLLFYHCLGGGGKRKDSKSGIPLY